MNLRPEDLGGAWHRHLVAQRTGGGDQQAEVRGLARLWTSRRGVPDAVSSAALPAAAGTSVFALPLAAVAGYAAHALAEGFASGPTLFAIATSAGLVGGAYGLLVLPRESAKRAIEAPVTAKEIRKLRKRKEWRERSNSNENRASRKEERKKAEWDSWNRLMSDDADEVIEEWVESLLGGGGRTSRQSSDPLSDWLSSLLGTRSEPKPTKEPSVEESFLRLVETLLEFPPGQDDDKLRETLRSVGDALGALPEPRTPDVDPAALIARARQVLRQAATESDHVVEASLVRQARALVDQSQSLERSLTVARRTTVLRRELRLQIDTLAQALENRPRSGASSAMDAHAAVEMSARVVAGIAQEARAVQDAREELADTLDPRWRQMGSQAQAPQRQRSGIGP